MNDISEKRPDFFEGQYLGADDLDSLVTYLRNHHARHALGAHTWGIAVGLELVELQGSSGDRDVFLLPGYAVDGYGRPIIVVNPYRLTQDLFARCATGAVELWLRFDEGPMQGVRPGFAVCDATDKYARVAESFALEAGRRDGVSDRQAGVTISGEAFDDAREAARAFDEQGPLVCDGSVPYQELPRPADDDRWLIPLGLVGWEAGPPGRFAELTPEQRLQSRRLRRFVGVVAESLLAPGGVIRLRDRRSPFTSGKEVDEQCAIDAVKLSDMCPDKPEFHELIWLEGRVRIMGDTRMFGTRLEFRDEHGTGYLNSNGQSGSTPLLIQRHERRNEPEDRDGDDLQLLIGKSDDGRNRLVVAQIEVTEGEDPCTPNFDKVINRVVVQDDGKVGVGTNKPNRLVTLERTDSAYLNVRTETTPTTPPEHEVLIGVDDNGAIVSAMTNDDLLLRAGANSTKVTIKNTGDVGIGTGAPDAKLDIANVKATLGGSALGEDKWLQAGNGGLTGRFWVEYGSQAAPLLVLSDKKEPPRIQFQQTGDNGQENSPEFSSWIGHASGSSTNLAMMGGRVGIGTLSPFVALTVQGSLGFKSSSEPMIYIYESGTANAERMVLAHSPTHDDSGLSYVDSSDAMLFKWTGNPVMAVKLSEQRVGIKTSVPSEALDVRGNIKLGDQGELFAPGSADKLRIIAGAISSLGTKITGVGFTSSKTGNGRYRILFDHAFLIEPVVLATARNASDDDTLITALNVSAIGFDLRCKDTTPTPMGGPLDPEGALEDTAFSFVVFGLRF